MNIRNKSLQQLLVFAIAFSLFILSVTTGQFVICVTSTHTVIELNGFSDCSKACEYPPDEKDGNSRSCNHCTDTVIILKEILKDKDSKNICTKCVFSMPGDLQSDMVSAGKISSLFSYLQNYKIFIRPPGHNLIETCVLLI